VDLPVVSTKRPPPRLADFSGEQKNHHIVFTQLEGFKGTEKQEQSGCTVKSPTLPQA
jgi:hypothetical protein